MSTKTCSAVNAEQDLASIPMAQGGLARLAISRLESAGLPVTPLLKRVGLTPQQIAEPEEIANGVKGLDHVKGLDQWHGLMVWSRPWFRPAKLWSLHHIPGYRIS